MSISTVATESIVPRIDVRKACTCSWVARREKGEEEKDAGTKDGEVSVEEEEAIGERKLGLGPPNELNLFVERDTVFVDEQSEQGGYGIVKCIMTKHHPLEFSDGRDPGG